MIKIRIDVDYPYPSRIRSFFYTALGLHVDGDYLKNSKIVAKMFNESTRKVRQTGSSRLGQFQIRNSSER